jgi:HlyD family secretion protein
MTGTIRFNVYVKEDAIVVPAKAVFAEELNPDERYVYVVKGDKYEKRPVTVGEQVKDNLEILSGLHDGEEILLEKPQEKSET